LVKGRFRLNKKDVDIHRIILCSNLKLKLKEVKNKLLNNEEVPLSSFFTKECFYLHTEEELKALESAIKKQLAECEKALKNRCIECANYNPKKRECLKHGDVPIEYVYQRNDCPDFDFCPF
jgi:hypothetical protein